MDIETIKNFLPLASYIVSLVLTIVFALKMFAAWKDKDELMGMIYFIAILILLNGTELDIIKTTVGA
jgi:hypothetical protein